MTLHKEAPEVRVYVAGTYQPDWHPVEVTLGSGGSMLPQAVLEVQPMARDPGRLQLLDVQLAAFDQPSIEIIKGTQVLHWGRVLARPASLDGEDGDRIRLISRMDPHHFGQPLNQTWFWDPATRAPVPHSLPTVFNPEWDGKIIGNANLNGHPAWGTLLFVHPASVETAEGAVYQRTTPFEWGLPEAAHYLCWALNAGQRFVRNPTLAEARAVLPNDRGVLRNHLCPAGAYLPQQLDRLLDSFGYGWKVEFSRGSRKIHFFARGQGPPRMLRLQEPGSALDMTQSNVESNQLKADVADRAFNIVRVYGEYKLHEFTAELVKGWDPAYDNASDGDLQKHSNAWALIQEKENVWRKWVLNEAGDYNGLRPGITRPFDFRAIFAPDSFLRRRRKLEPCLTQQWDNTPMGHAGGVYIEWWDAGGEGEPGQWVPIDTLSAEGRQVRILQRECGIYFDGLLPPAEIRDQASRAKVRITASVYSDTRSEVRIVRHPASLLSDFKEESVDVGSRFKIRKRHRSSRFVGTSRTVDETDDTPFMRNFASRLIDNWNLATLDGTVTLTGVDYIYRGMIGTTISGINGRNVDFNVAPPGLPVRYPTVVGARINFEQQTTEITLDTFRGGITG